MKLLIVAICLFCMANVYYDGRLISIVRSWEKYYKMAGIAFAGLSIYLAMSKGKLERHDIIQATTGLVSSLPIDRDASGMLARVLAVPHVSRGEKRMRESGVGGTTKRSVSETKKKYVAAGQNWTCNGCQKPLSAWFEIDHVISLQQGGSNHVDNLVALCRECHAEKTAASHMEMNA